MRAKEKKKRRVGRTVQHEHKFNDEKTKSKKKQKQCILTCQNSCEGKSFIAVAQKIVSETVCTLTEWATTNGLSCAL